MSLAFLSSLQSRAGPSLDEILRLNNNLWMREDTMEKMFSFRKTSPTDLKVGMVVAKCDSDTGAALAMYEVVSIGPIMVYLVGGDTSSDSPPASGSLS